jgi:hypothetical protein
MQGRRVIVFKQRPGTDRKLDTDRSHLREGGGFEDGRGYWGRFRRPAAGHNQVYAKVTREVHDEFVCRGDRSPTI